MHTVLGMNDIKKAESYYYGLPIQTIYTQYSELNVHKNDQLQLCMERG